MTVYLNTNKSFENYKKLYNSKYFVDKSEIINKLNELIETSERYVCITRPSEFGKSSIVDMLGAYYMKETNSKDIFNQLNISSSENYEEHLNKHNVISLTFNKLSDRGNTYEDYITMIKTTLVNDIVERYPYINPEKYFTISDMLFDTHDKFIFIFDEWDYIFSNNLFVENHNEFLEFIRQLLKDQPYVTLAYMTGVLPIKKYSSGSALNMFDEFTFLKDRVFDEYFGFTNQEIKTLCSRSEAVAFEDLEKWYNGYLTAKGNRIYNPRSVVKALQNGYCESYWTNTGAMDEVGEYLKYNILEIREDVLEMVAGEEIDIFIDEEYRAGQAAPKTKEEIYSAMIILGFLSYYDGYLKIPNKELMKEFEKALKDESFGYVSEIIKKSRRMLKATTSMDSDTVIEILHDIHNSEIPILQYNDENSLACVLTLAYLSARDTYRVEREEKSGKGYTDFSFHPRRKNDIAFIVELKKDERVDVAINQIRKKEYVQKFKEETNQILAVAICYDSKNKEHQCKIEWI
ncbi:MAG TPA: AAA family ATPase [Firmicutes bacterium]|nr:AAA family ATPase [Bacillota bacterium]